MAQDAVQLESVTISGDRYESATGPVDGYRATHSATATRSDVDIRDTPQSIEVVPAQVLEDLNTTRIDRALDFAGGVSRQNNFGGLTFLNYSVRGFTTGELYRNGFAINRGSYSAPDASGIERIEVLKGPSASLYGRGDPGGLVNIVGKKPQAEAFSRLNLSAGSWDRYRASLDANTPLSEDGSLLSRINLAVEDNGSFRDHVDNRRQVVTPSLSWQLDADTLLQLDAEFARTESVFDRGLPAVGGELGAVRRSAFFSEPNDGDIRNDNQTLDLALERHLDEGWKLRLANHYTQGHLRGDSSEPQRLVGDTLTRFYRQRDFEWNDSITQVELHGSFELAGWQHQSLIGLEYENYRNSQKYPQSETLASYGLNIRKPVYGTPKPPITRPNDFHERTESYALNLQDQIAFTDRLRGLLGVRLERVEQRSLNRASGVANEQRKDVATPRIGLLYQLVPEVGLFANAGTSFKPNAIGSRGEVYQPEKGLGYETGLKLDLLDGRLGGSMALFHIDKENVVTTDALGDSVAAGEARSRGLDLQFSGQLSDALRLIGAYAYIDAEVTKGDAALPAGSDLLGIPRHSGSLLAVYEFQHGALRGSDIGAAVTHVGERSGQAGSDFRLPAYETLDLLAHYKASEQVTLGVNLNNVFDRKYYERAYNSVWVLPGEPRNLSFSLTLDL
ncbi:MULTISPECIES: TonB-dependent siderophore receptor [unclassified Pseudomonas]|uniref:TonB-dependent siderophore receptor n=1 Tax=unclassified Pseudomonas TaxID=196821 RepID=UPI0024472503|nr:MULTISPECIES: TonB-dependent siderophore receptor [unclassified Pseudomonas]MDG9928565.1 TonB-dependent siderophore receptor [Pseudomonas sp. GD04042]MDH0482735.1 TonB-dependent siderophore receptor [Pseudomonas sp. GD04015]MDH0604563.1 TonB-dependent siderophore receptor [Pseudomonas sp. GD03869]